MLISHIVAVSRNFVIGTKNKLPWRMPDDMNYFHRVTIGHVVVMGRKNYEANGGALKGRTNIVITRDKSFKPEDAQVAYTIDMGISLAKSHNPEELFIVGGGEIYRQTLSMADRIYITMIDMEAEGETSYPRIDFNNYKIISRIHKSADKINPYNHTYYILEK